MKVGDLVMFIGHAPHPEGRPARRHGIILSFDDDNDPVVLWTKWKFPEPNFRSHIAVISKS